MKKQYIRNSLIEHIEMELKKDSGDIDPDFIDGRIDELYALDGLSPQKLGDKELCAASSAVRARALFRRSNIQAEQRRKRRFMHRVVRGAAAACCALLFFLSANYVTTLLSGSCLLSKVGIKVCCGTQFCRCQITEVKE